MTQPASSTTASAANSSVNANQDSVNDNHVKFKPFTYNLNVTRSLVSKALSKEFSFYSVAAKVVAVALPILLLIAFIDGIMTALVRTVGNGIIALCNKISGEKKVEDQAPKPLMPIVTQGAGSSSSSAMNSSSTGGVVSGAGASQFAGDAADVVGSTSPKGTVAEGTMGNSITSIASLEEAAAANSASQSQVLTGSDYMNERGEPILGSGASAKSQGPAAASAPVRAATRSLLMEAGIENGRKMGLSIAAQVFGAGNGATTAPIPKAAQNALTTAPACDYEAMTARLQQELATDREAERQAKASAAAQPLTDPAIVSIGKPSASSSTPEEQQRFLQQLSGSPARPPIGSASSGGETPAAASSSSSGSGSASGMTEEELDAAARAGASPRVTQRNAELLEQLAMSNLALESSLPMGAQTLKRAVSPMIFENSGQTEAATQTSSVSSNSSANAGSTTSSSAQGRAASPSAGRQKLPDHIKKAFQSPPQSTSPTPVPVSPSPKVSEAEVLRNNPKFLHVQQGANSTVTAAALARANGSSASSTTSATPASVPQVTATGPAASVQHGPAPVTSNVSNSATPTSAVQTKKEMGKIGNATVFIIEEEAGFSEYGSDSNLIFLNINHSRTPKIHWSHDSIRGSESTKEMNVAVPRAIQPNDWQQAYTKILSNLQQGQSIMILGSSWFAASIEALQALNLKKSLPISRVYLVLDKKDSMETAESMVKKLMDSV